ncbi:MAG: hypothetical protein GY938_05255 [Ketobacter sp.]|nr:hypothetical protein [Ketobacter sp.]
MAHTPLRHPAQVARLTLAHRRFSGRYWIWHKAQLKPRAGATLGGGGGAGEVERRLRE